VAQPQSGENNNTFDHLGKTNNELKLTVFPKKNGQPKRSILALRLVL
jgi:hypothetical protein